jgi:hypothetical protein
MLVVTKFDDKNRYVEVLIDPLIEPTVEQRGRSPNGCSTDSTAETRGVSDSTAWVPGGHELDRHDRSSRPGSVGTGDDAGDGARRVRRRVPPA